MPDLQGSRVVPATPLPPPDLEGSTRSARLSQSCSRSAGCRGTVGLIRSRTSGSNTAGSPPPGGGLAFFFGSLFLMGGWQALISRAGRPSSSAARSSWVCRIGVADRLHWFGMVSGDLKWGAFNAAALFCLPSHQENFGIAVAEALACGLPIRRPLPPKPCSSGWRCRRRNAGRWASAAGRCSRSVLRSAWGQSWMAALVPNAG